jgi:geranylgeranyl diphosphate synthase type I
MAGQYLDLVEQVRGEFAAARSLHVAALKSGRYSVERPLLLGAAIAGADPELTAGLSAVGYDVGVAFQLRDDLLGVFGDPGLTGKPAGDDLREGKRTVLVALADKQGDPRQRALLRRELGRPTLDDGLIGQLQAVLIDTGAVDAVERMIAECADRARTRLAALPCDPVARHQLQQLADAALHRYR